MKRYDHLTPGEFELMEILWELGEGSVREVRERLEADRPLAYTTVMTVLDKLRRKKVLRQRRAGKLYLYSPRVGREEALRQVVGHIVDTYFHGSEADLRRFLRGEAAGARTTASGAAQVSPARETARPAAGNVTEDDALDEFLL